MPEDQVDDAEEWADAASDSATEAATSATAAARSALDALTNKQDTDQIKTDTQSILNQARTVEDEVEQLQDRVELTASLLETSKQAYIDLEADDNSDPKKALRVTLEKNQLEGAAGNGRASVDITSAGAQSFTVGFATGDTNTPSLKGLTYNNGIWYSGQVNPTTDFVYSTTSFKQQLDPPF